MDQPPLLEADWNTAAEGRVAQNERAESRASELRAKEGEPTSSWISSRILAPRAGFEPATLRLTAASKRFVLSDMESHRGSEIRDLRGFDAGGESYRFVLFDIERPH